MNNPPQEAERIAQMGYPVFPCRNPGNDPSATGKKGKIPLISGGVSNASTDPVQVAEWWTRWPSANIGLACRNCLVIDLDNKDGKNGSEDFAKIAESLGPVDAVSVAATGSGGFHYFFARPEIDIVGQTGVEWNGRKTGIDIRVGNQYVIAPPSLHESGVRYAWQKPLVPPEQLRPIPQAWIDHFLPQRGSKLILPKLPAMLFADDKTVARCRKYVATMPEAVDGQSGHSTTLCVANAIFWGFGLDEHAGWPILLEYSHRCKPPWSEFELRHKMNEAINKPRPGKEFCWLLNSNRNRYEFGDFDYRAVANDTARNKPPRSGEDELISPALSTFSRETLTYLWPGRLFNGKLILLCGDGSVGKTWFLCYLCAIISRGFNWPDGTPCEQGGVIFFTSEDGAGDTLRPRIEDNGGDPEHIYVPEVIMQPDGHPREFSIDDVKTLARRIEKLEEVYGEGYVKLVIFDPITAFMGNIDEFKNNQVRAAFRPLARLADEKKFALIGVGHPKKGAEMGKAKDAFAGSIAYTNAARLVWNFYHDRESGIRRMLLAKNNLMQNPKGLSYIVNDGIVSFTDTNIEIDADDYQRKFQNPKSGERSGNKVAAAIDWLLEYLEDGPKPSGNKNDPKPETVFGDALKKGFKVNTVWRAADELGVRKAKEEFSKRWIWSLPCDTEVAPPPETQTVYKEFEAFG